MFQSSLCCYLAPGGGCEVLFSPGLSVCLSVCVCVCVCLCVRPIFGILFLGYQKRYRSEIYIGYLYSCTQFNEKYWPSYVKGQGHWDGSLLFKGAVISQKLGHRKIYIFFHRHLLAYSIRWNNKNLSEQRNDVTKNSQYLTLTCKTPIPKLLILIKLSIQI